MNTLGKISTTNKFIKWLIIVTIIIIVLNIIDEFLGNPSWQIERLIGVGYEGNFPTWFSSMLLAIAAYYAYKCSVLAQTIKAGKRMWQLLSLGLLGMSCDETAQIHEHLGNTLNKYFFNNTDNIKHSAWAVILGPFVLLAIVIFTLKIKKFLKGSAKAAEYLLIGVFVYIAGAFILESTINFLNHQNLELIWKIENILEETCEMFGSILIIKGLMEHYTLLTHSTTPNPAVSPY